MRVLFAEDHAIGDGWVTIKADPVGNPGEVWSLRDGVLRGNGVWGYLRTEEMFTEPYELTLEWRWPGEGGNSGVLLQMSGPDKLWPRGIEVQLESVRAGDLYLLDGATAEGVTAEAPFRHMQGETTERPVGEWNELRVRCADGGMTVWVNGAERNRLTGVSERGGMIGFQSEGTPIEFREVQWSASAGRR